MGAVTLPVLLASSSTAPFGVVEAEGRARRIAPVGQR